MTVYPEVISLIPHRPPMLLVRRLLDVQEKTGTAEVIIGDNHLFLRKDGTLLPETCCELIAQSFGACEAYRRIQKGLSVEGGGYLASVHDMESFLPAHVGDRLAIQTEKMDDMFGTYIVQGKVFCNEVKLAQATVYIFMWQGDAPTQTL